MSAIGGVVRFDGALSEDLLTAFRDALAPYGTDAQHVWFERNAGLVRTLRHVTPEDALDRQPLVTQDQGQVMVFSGRLDNRDELADRLGIDANTLATLADGALVSAAHARWREDCAARLVGAFTFAVWEARAQRLLLVRDPVGARPLYWHSSPRLFAFASCAHVLHLLPDVSRVVDEERLADFLALLPSTGPQSLFRGVQRLEPGQALIVEDGRVRTMRYHRFDAGKRIRLPRDEDYVEAFRAQVESAVRACLRSSGPVGSHLSSGYDSSTVSATAARLLRSTGQTLTCFTAVPREGFTGPVRVRRHADESIAAAAVAALHPNIEHVRVPGLTGILPLTREYARTTATPVLNPCNATWIYAIWDEAQRRSIRALLNAGMGNMTISWAGGTLLPSLLRRGRLLRWAREVEALHRTQRMNWRQVVKATIAPLVPHPVWSRLKAWRSTWSLHSYSAIHPGLAARSRLSERAARSGFDLDYQPAADGPAIRLQSLQRMDVGDVYLAAMARAGVDPRDPTQDQRLVEFSLSLPEEQFMRLGQDRWILRRAFGCDLPREILQARTKGLQTADWFEHLTRERSAILQELEQLQASAVAARCLDLDALRTAVESWPTSGWERAETEWTYRQKLMRGLAVGAFIRYAAPGAAAG